LRFGGDGMKLMCMELLQCDVGPRGCASLGQALGFGGNVALATLRLDCNPDIGDEGAQLLSAGLCSNGSLKHLHLSFCNVSPAGAAALSGIIAYSGSALLTFNLKVCCLCCYSHDGGGGGGGGGAHVVR
ncbi:MAG: hypothetical protein ACK4YT_13695, partial [Sphingomonas sp.]